MFELDEERYIPPPAMPTTMPGMPQKRFKKASQAKRGRTKPNGRGPSFDNCQARVTAFMQQHPAFQSLNGSALRVLLMAMTKYENSKYHMKRDPEGRYVFSFTYQDARTYCNLSDVTFSKAIQALEDIGFIQRTVKGGLKGCNGVMSIYSISDAWKSWKCSSVQNHENIKKALAEKQRSTKGFFRGSDHKPLKESLEVVQNL